MQSVSYLLPVKIAFKTNMFLILNGNNFSIYFKYYFKHVKNIRHSTVLLIKILSLIEISNAKLSPYNLVVLKLSNI